MLSITFHPDSDLKDYSQDISSYEALWREEGETIVEAWRKATGLEFQETYIHATVFDGISHSHPLSLRCNYDDERRKTVLVHELGHRLLHKKVPGGKTADSLQLHKLLFLVLHEVFTDLYGKEVSDRAVEWDSNLPRPQYKEAWEWALSFSVEERKRKFQEILEGGYSLLN